MLYLTLRRTICWADVFILSSNNLRPCLETLGANIAQSSSEVRTGASSSSNSFHNPCINAASSSSHMHSGASIISRSSPNDASLCASRWQGFSCSPCSITSMSRKRCSSLGLLNASRTLHTSAAPHSDAPSTSDKGPEAGPARIYWDKRRAGMYHADPRQELTIQMLQDLYDRLIEGVGQPRRLRGKRSGLTMVDAVAEPSSSSGGGFWSGFNTLLKGSRSTGGDLVVDRPHIQGLYMYGGVGCGKTMLMDLFVESAPPELQVQRTHFHDFMLEVHTKLRDYKNDRDPLLRVADAIAKTVRVLAMDEFFVTDVADAMILHRLFGRLWDREVVLVATSNREPDKLYEGGLQRSLFMPFIHRLKVECIEHNMDSKIDYRRLAHSQRGLYFSPLSGDGHLREEFVREAEDNGVQAVPQTVQVAMGRHLDVALSAGKACMFTFSDLCGRPVAAADYIALTQHYHMLALSGVPVFTAANVPQAYRFVTLIDVLYEHRVRVLLSAEALPFDLFANILTNAELAANPSFKSQPDIVVDDNLGFAKDRTISRLTEMQSLEYLLAHAQKHVPENVLALEEAKNQYKFWLSHHRKEQ